MERCIYGKKSHDIRRRRVQNIRNNATVYIGHEIDLEFLLDNTNATEMEDDDEPFDMDGVREKLIEHTNDLCKVDTALIAILNGTFDSDKHRLPKYDLSK